MLPATVKDLRELLVDLPDDVVLSYERVEDVYFDKHGWVSEKVPDRELGGMDGMDDEYVNVEVIHFDSDKNKLRFSAHY